MQQLQPGMMMPSQESLTSSKVQFFISGRNLKDMDIVGVSDPFVIVFMRDHPTQPWKQFGRTEMIKDNLNPDFEQSFIIQYFFEKHQYVKFEVQDGNNVSGNNSLIGSVETTVGSIVGSRQQTFIGDVVLPGKTASRGKLIVRADSVKESNMEITMRVGGLNLPTTASCLCANNNIYLEIYRGTPELTNWFKVKDFDPVVGNLNPVFSTFTCKGQ
jgi:Ca2+-dependent lipid-binding protein